MKMLFPETHIRFTSTDRHIFTIPQICITTQKHPVNKNSKKFSEIHVIQLIYLIPAQGAFCFMLLPT